MLSVAFAVALAAPPAAEWVDLLDAGPTNPWAFTDRGWVFAEAVALDPANGKKLKPSGTGGVWVNGPGRLPNLITRKEYADVEVRVEFLLGKGSNAGVKFQAVYEIQLLDSFGKAGELTGNDCGGIYPRADLKPPHKYLDKGVPPRVNSAKPAGEWQTLTATFVAPKFDAAGKVTATAKLAKAELNGQVIHENVEWATPTGSNWAKKPMATGPLMLQCDHGPTAWRNVRVREIKS